jgi:hypothetical protein
MQQFRQWNQMNVDFNEQKSLFSYREKHHLEPNGPNNLSLFIQIIHTGHSMKIMRRYKIKIFW